MKSCWTRIQRLAPRAVLTELLEFVNSLSPRIVQLQISTAEKYRDEIDTVVKAIEVDGQKLEFVFEGSRQESESAARLIAELV